MPQWGSGVRVEVEGFEGAGGKAVARALVCFRVAPKHVRHDERTDGFLPT